MERWLARSERVRAATVAVAFSVGGHAVIAWTVPTPAPGAGLGWSAWDDDVELTIVIAADETRPVDEAPTAALPEPAPEMERPSPRLASTVRASLGPRGEARSTVHASESELAPSQLGTSVASPTSPPGSLEGSRGATESSPGTPRTVPVAPWNVVPSAVARGDVASGVPGPPTSADAERAMEAEIDTALREAARAPHLSERPPPSLRRTSDGGYRWEGTGFTARIEPDGAVSFSDLPGLRFGGLGPEADPTAFADFRPAPGALPPGSTVDVRFRFDITEALERRHGNDPYYADRAWFLEQTEEVRDRLARRHAEEQHRRQLLRLRGRLDALMRDESRPLAARHREVFATWDDFDEDEVGRRARDALIGFVRERWPEGSANAFTDAELDALNTGRVSTERFEPYGR
jgi:hypothetical protein